MVAAADRGLQAPVDFGQQSQAKDGAEDHEDDGTVLLEDRDRLVAVGRDQHGQHDDDQQGHAVRYVPLWQAGEAGQLRHRLRRDDAVDGEPANRQKEREEGAGIGATNAEGLAGRDHLGGPEAWPGDTQ